VVRRVRLYSVPPTIDYNKTPELVSVISYLWSLFYELLKI
jgi:hypothetical protein